MDLQNWACLNMLVIFGVHKNTPEWCLMVSRCFSDTPELKNYSSNINQLVGWSNQVMNSVPGDSILGLNHRIFRAAVFQANPTREKCRILEKSRWEKSRWAGKKLKTTDILRIQSAGSYTRGSGTRGCPSEKKTCSEKDKGKDGKADSRGVSFFYNALDLKTTWTEQILVSQGNDLQMAEFPCLSRPHDTIHRSAQLHIKLSSKKLQISTSLSRSLGGSEIKRTMQSTTTRVSPTYGNASCRMKFMRLEPPDRWQCQIVWPVDGGRSNWERLSIRIFPCPNHSDDTLVKWLASGSYHIPIHVSQTMCHESLG